MLKCDSIRKSPAEISTKHTANSKIYINIRLKDSLTSLMNSNLEISFEVIKKADNSRYSNGNPIRRGILGPIALSVLIN